MDYSLLLCIEKRESKNATTGGSTNSNGHTIDLNMTEDSDAENLYSTLTHTASRNRENFKKK